MDDATAAEIMFGSAPKPAAPAQPSSDDIAAERLFGTNPAKDAPTKPIADPAARLFGGPDTKPVASEEREPRTEEEQAASLFGEKESPKVELDIPADILAERKADKDRAMFSPQATFKDVIPDNMFDGAPEASDMPEPVRMAAIAEVREMVADMGMSTDEVQTLRELGRTLGTEQPSQDQVMEWREESVVFLNQTYGNQATQALRDAQAFIAQDPRRVKMLDHQNRGDHPKVIALFAKLGRKARIAGKLKAGNGKR